MITAMASPPSGDNEEETRTKAKESGASPNSKPKLPLFNSADFKFAEDAGSKTLEEMVRIAFKSPVIDTHDHPIVRELRGR
jgi:hypothetical protein